VSRERESDHLIRGKDGGIHTVTIMPHPGERAEGNLEGKFKFEIIQESGDT
jgi:hypothetical protein